jgi:ribosome-associated protein
VREDAEGEALEPVERVSHRTIQAEDAELEVFVGELLELPGDRRRRLPVDASLVDALDECLRLEGSAKARMLRRVKRLLRGHDIDALKGFLADEAPDEQRARTLERWRARILEEGDAAIHDFVEQFPAADRQAIRSLARTAQGDSPAARRAAKKLFQELKAAVPLEVG